VAFWRKQAGSRKNVSESDPPPGVRGESGTDIYRGAGRCHNGHTRRSLGFARVRSILRMLCKLVVSANGSERARTFALTCHAEGRGFESHHPLFRNPLETAGFCRRGASRGGRPGFASQVLLTGEPFEEDGITPLPCGPPSRGLPSKLARGVPLRAAASLLLITRARRRLVSRIGPCRPPSETRPPHQWNARFPPLPGAYRRRYGV
jgi:hypothetical protein